MRDEGGFSSRTAQIDLAGLAPGRYTFTAAAGTVGHGTGPFTDTRTITVR